MAVIPTLLVRDGTSTTKSMTPTMMNLLIALVALLVFGILLVAGLFILRARRKAKQMQKLTDLPFRASSPSSRNSNHRRLTITATPYGRNSKAIDVYHEKEIMVDGESSPLASPSTPLPEIRITFPEEESDGSKRKSGRVVVVRISENGGVGLEPFNDEHLPPYQQADAERFQSLDLERIGGLKELDRGEKI